MIKQLIALWQRLFPTAEQQADRLKHIVDNAIRPCPNLAAVEKQVRSGALRHPQVIADAIAWAMQQDTKLAPGGK